MQNKYEVLGVVGEGAYGIVYKCRNKETKEYVAIKKFKETEDEIVKKTMKRELRVLQLLKHDNIVEFKEAFKRKNNLFLVFEFIERNLLELLEEQPNGLEPQLIKSLIYQLCKSVKYLHEQNIIHRDIKPENLLITNSMKLKLCDFGFARKIAQNKKENLTDYVATRWYRSPELLITNGSYGPEVDYWAIGCIMGELADGRPLFPGEDETDQLHCIQKVLGNLPEDQVDMFYKNPLYVGNKLLDVQKPETLEKRYMGKLPKIAINFMKGLLELNPKKRLIGDRLFQHPYFACFNENNKTQSNSLHHNNSSQSQREKKNSSKTISKQNSGKNIAMIQNGSNANSNTSTINASSNKMINTTTNINIINFNTYNNGNNNDNTINHENSPPSYKTHNISQPNLCNKVKRKKDKHISSMAMTMTNQFPIMYQKNFSKNQPSVTSRKSYEIKNDNEFPSTTSINFNNSNIKDNLNIATLLPSNAYLTGYKTFYKNKNDVYNYNINTNFSNVNYYGKVKKKHNKNSIIEEEEEDRQTSTKKSKSLNQKPKGKSNNNNTSNYYESSPLKEKNKYGMYYNSNKSNSPYHNSNQSHSKGHYANYGAMPNISCFNTKEKINSYRENNERSGQCFLPSLPKNVYHANFKKFHQMINK